MKSYYRRSGDSRKHWSEILGGVLTWILHRPRTFIGGVLGVIVGLLVHWLGIWGTLILIGCVIVGVIIGKYFDDREKVGEVLDRLFTSDH